MKHHCPNCGYYRTENSTACSHCGEPYEAAWPPAPTGLEAETAPQGETFLTGSARNDKIAGVLASLRLVYGLALVATAVSAAMSDNGSIVFLAIIFGAAANYFWGQNLGNRWPTFAKAMLMTLKVQAMIPVVILGGGLAVCAVMAGVSSLSR